MNTATASENDPEEHGRHSIDSTAFELLVIALAVTQAAIWYAVSRDWTWVAVPLVLIAAHLMHGLLIGFHEASHSLLRRSRILNEFDGHLMGILSLTPFSLYRTIHQAHHIHLATEKDEEFWPFVSPRVPRWARRLFAMLELSFGYILTPMIFFRAFLRPGSRVQSRRMRRRIWAEIALVLVVWTCALSVITWFGVWKYFLWMYLAPALIAGNLQSWRRYIEHVGLTGDTINSCTRSIVPGSWLGRFFAFTLLHEPYHGIHHLCAGLPHVVLPQHTSKLAPRCPGERVPFVSYRHALHDLFRSLADPRIGAHWRDGRSL